MKYLSENEFRTELKTIWYFITRKAHAKNGYKTPVKRELEFISNQAKKFIV